MARTTAFRTRCLLSVIWLTLTTANAARANDPAVSLQVEPTQANLVGNLARLQLQVTGTRANGQRVDLTRDVDYQVAPVSLASVSTTGAIVPLTSGTGKIGICLGTMTVEIPITITHILPRAQVSFQQDVIPILSRAGCNQGACHGAQFGKGGFRLSLLGFAPEQDYRSLVREHPGRRISLLRPADSLLLRKALMEFGHQGGKRFQRNSYDHQVLTAWLAAGAPAPQTDEAEVVDLIVSPAEGVYRVGQQQQLRVVAHYSDHSTRDVTRTAKYDTLSEAIATVTEAGTLTCVGQGQIAVMVRYAGQAKVSHVLSPFQEQVDLAGFQPRTFIDEHVKARWKRLGIQPTTLCSDAVFIRRAFLDAIGTLPKPKRVGAFLQSDNPRKRDDLVDELLGLTGDPNRDLYVEPWSGYWALKWGDLLRNNRKQTGVAGMWSLFNWTRRALRENMPVDQFVRELITAEGSTLENGPANFYRIARKPTELAEATAQVFLGVRIQCARCHHHPYESYSQSDYYGLAAFFTRVGTKNNSKFDVLGGNAIVRLNSSGSITHPRLGMTMVPTPLLGDPIEVEGVRDLRRPLADWLTSPENRLFARNIVNRIWSYYMGSGLVEPVDDLRATNPASNPELLDALGEHLIEIKFDVRRLMRTIMISRVYQLSSTTVPDNAYDRRFYPHYNIKRLPAEVLLDAIDAACGTHERFNGVPLGTRAIELPDPNFESYFLDTLGRPQRAIACECERTAEANLAQILHIANGELLSRKLVDKQGRISQLVENNDLNKPIPAKQAIDHLYLASYSRLPTSDEFVECQQVLSRAPNPREGLEDLLWALLNSREFLVNH
ncbi:MAG: S-layer related protein (Precursor) [Planctomycetaceae bacterium]|nr:S-layer related protein (Precursor) [Planctomycetaceae bacterium]